ncbi:class I SAM-dependent methyltransferase [Dongia soli]|uniref:SAM-dependent methyltransferase n=1 Tax=Dongia soli TaxID=600628 RepID=A0ABU5E8E1_9PROT|nr:SAM-dependent methyltransferase [Dongia soli]MDY0882479.1 SAM-dependent methyltransferase [Dongia soli]
MTASSSFSAHSSKPSPWVIRFADTVPQWGPVLDLAAGKGRHARYFKSLGYKVAALDRDVGGLADLAGDPRIEIIAANLEDGSPWPLAGRRFAGIVVANYLHRPLMPYLIQALAPGGVLIYETFALGNERYGRPSNPDFLLRPGELLDYAKQHELTVLGYEQVEMEEPKPAVIQHLAARRESCRSEA